MSFSAEMKKMWWETGRKWGRWGISRQLVPRSKGRSRDLPWCSMLLGLRVRHLHRAFSRSQHLHLSPTERKIQDSLCMHAVRSRAVKMRVRITLKDLAFDWQLFRSVNCHSFSLYDDLLSWRQAFKISFAVLPAIFSMYIRLFTWSTR